MTSDVSIYHIPSSVIRLPIADTPCCLNVIDVPGFGDTRGEAYDAKITDMVKHLLEDLDSLDYIMLVVKHNETRFVDSLKVVF